MTQVRIAQAAEDFDAGRRKAVIRLGTNIFGGDGRTETGPSGAGIKFG
jgi:hypothetical protein